MRPAVPFAMTGGTGGRVKTLDHASLDLTAEIEIVVRVGLTSWATGSAQTLLSKEDVGSQRSFRLSVGAAGTLTLALSANGSAENSAGSSSAVGFSAGQAGWVKATWKAGDAFAQFFTAADNETEPTFAQLGTNQALSIVSIFGSTTDIWLGVRGNGVTQPAAGSLYQAIVRSTVGGAAVCSFNSNGLSGGAYVDGQGRTWTVL